MRSQALYQLEKQGYTVWRVYGCSAIDQARSQMATDALAAGFEELMWIDSDIRFPVASINMNSCPRYAHRLRVYPKKGSRELVVHLKPETKSLVFGEGGALSKSNMPRPVSC